MTGLAPDHAGARRALALLKAHLLEMECLSGDGVSTFTVADVVADLLVGTGSLIDHHERWWLREQMVTEVSRIVPMDEREMRGRG